MTPAEVVFNNSDLTNIIFKSVLSLDYPNFALINTKCYKNYTKFLSTTLRSIPRSLILRYAVQTFQCHQCHYTIKSKHKYQCSDHSCLKPMCKSCYKQSYTCKRCRSFRGYDRSEYDKPRQVCNKCLRTCQDCKTIKHCFDQCDSCHRSLCIDCLRRVGIFSTECTECLN